MLRLLLLILLLLVLLLMRLRRGGTGLVVAGGSSITGSGCSYSLLLPAVAIQILEERAGVEAAVVLVLVPELKIIKIMANSKLR